MMFYGILLLIVWVGLISSQTVTITNPTSSPKQSFAAGSTVPVTISYSGTSVPIGIVILNCPGIGSSSQSLSYPTTNFAVVSGIYGDTCTFSVSATDYTSTNTVDVTITQPLTFSLPIAGSTVTIPDSIPLALTTTPNSISTRVEVEFSCDGNPSILDALNITTNVNYAYNYPQSANGTCAFSVSYVPSYLVAPSSRTVLLKYRVNFSTPPTKIYVGQRFSVTLSGTRIPNGATTSLELVQNGNVVQTFSPVAIGSPVTLIAGTNLNPTFTATLRVPLSNTYVESTSAPITVENVQLVFSNPPQGQTYQYSDNIPILINSAQVANILPSPQTISVTLTCPNSSPNIFTVTIGTTFNFNNLQAGLGGCTISATSPLSYLLSPSSVTINRRGLLSLNAPSQFAAGSSVSLNVAYNPLPDQSTSSFAILTCSSTGQAAYNQSIPINNPVLNVPTGFYGSCSLYVESWSNSFVTYNSSALTPIVTQVLSYASPSSNADIVIPNFIPVRLVTSNAPGIAALITMGLNCPSNPTTQSFIVTTNAAQPSNYTYPINYFGTCSLSTSSVPNYLVAPNPRSINLRYALNIVVNPIIYIGQQFSVSVSCTSPCSTIPSTALKLVQGATSIQTYPLVFIGTVTTLSAPNNLVNNGDYTIVQDQTTSFASSTSNTITAANTQLRFSQPVSGSSYAPGAPIPILIDSAQVSNIASQVISLSLVCDGAVIDTFSYTVSTSQFYSNVYAFGYCSFNATSPVSYLIVPSPVLFTVKGFAAITSPTSPPKQSFAAGSSIPVTLSYYPESYYDFSTNATLSCPTTTTVSAPVYDSSGFIDVPDNFFGETCTLSLVSSLYIVNYTVPVSITQPLNFITPDEGSNYTIPFPVGVRVGNVSTGASIPIRFTCDSGYSATFSAIASLLTGAGYSNNAYGPCSLTILSAPSYYNIIDNNVNIRLKYQPVYNTVPSTVIVGQSFNIKIDTTVTPAFAVTVELQLYCNYVVIQSWNNVLLNTLVSLTVFSGVVPTNDCSFFINFNPYVRALSKSVNVSFAKSPTNGNVYPISRAEQLEFLKLVTLPRDRRIYWITF